MIGNKFKYYSWLLPIGFTLLLMAAWNDWFGAGDHPDMQKYEPIQEVKMAKFTFKSDKFDTANFRKELINLEIWHSNIVYAQAKLETGNFRSKLFLENNNLFGFRNRKGQWMKFDNWKSCCKFYKEWQDLYYKGGDYYKFLTDIGYAEDTNYVNKVKRCLN